MHLHALNFGFGFGAIISTQLARPFLSDDFVNVTNITLLNNTLDGSSCSVSTIEIPYFSVSVFTFVIAIILFMFYIRGPPPGFTLQRTNVPRGKLRSLVTSCSGGQRKATIGLLTLLFFYFAQSFGGERAYGKFLFSYAIECDLRFTKKEASTVQTVFWGSFTAGRALGIALARILPVSYIIIGDIAGNILVSSVLATMAHRARSVLMMCSSLMGVFISLLVANGFAWTNLYLEVNSMSVMVLMVGGSAGGFFYQFFTGYFFQNYGPDYLMYVMVFYSLMLAVIFACMQLVGNAMGQRFQKEVDKVNVELKDVSVAEDDRL